MRANYLRGSMKHIFKQSVPRNGNPADAKISADVAFVTGGIKAAFHTKNAVRETILDDVSQALNCSSEDLAFLFENNDASETESNVFDFPDADRRRWVIRENQLNAAE